MAEAYTLPLSTELEGPDHHLLVECQVHVMPLRGARGLLQVPTSSTDVPDASEMIEYQIV